MSWDISGIYVAMPTGSTALVLVNAHRSPQTYKVLTDELDATCAENDLILTGTRNVAGVVAKKVTLIVLKSIM